MMVLVPDSVCCRRSTALRLFAGRADAKCLPDFSVVMRVGNLDIDEAVNSGQ
jgi:hypothetical protein